LTCDHVLEVAQEGWWQKSDEQRLIGLATRS
jgi:hypothetical protein